MWLKNFALFLIWFAIIIYLSFTPLPGWPKINTLEQLQFDKLVHIGMYAVFSFLLLRSFFIQQNRTAPSSIVTVSAILFCVAVGIAIEFLQPILTLFRKFEVLDMVADSIGAVAGFYVFKYFTKKKWFGLKPA